MADLKSDCLKVDQSLHSGISAHVILSFANNDSLVVLSS